MRRPPHALQRAAPSRASARQSRQKALIGQASRNSSSRHSHAAPRTPLESPWTFFRIARRAFRREGIALDPRRQFAVERVDLRQPAADHDGVGIEDIDDARRWRARSGRRMSPSWRARRSPPTAASAISVGDQHRARLRLRIARASAGPLHQLSMQPRLPQ